MDAGTAGNQSARQPGQAGSQRRQRLPAVIAFAGRHSRGYADVARTVSLCYTVCDGFRWHGYTEVRLDGAWREQSGSTQREDFPADVAREATRR